LVPLVANVGKLAGATVTLGGHWEVAIPKVAAPNVTARASDTRGHGVQFVTAACRVTSDVPPDN
jgi:hypothetical protein